MEYKIDIFIDEIQIVNEGKSIPYHHEVVVSSMASEPDVRIKVSLNLGDSTATAWGCDLTEDYVVFNSAYTT